MRFVIVLLAIAGVWVSYLALKVHNSTETQPCSINERWDCGAVNHSKYAEIQSIPVAAIGMAGYALIGLLALVGKRWPLLVTALAGLAFALRLSYIEAKVLMTWCMYCVASQAIIAAITLLSIVWLAIPRRRPASS